MFADIVLIHIVFHPFVGRLVRFEIAVERIFGVGVVDAAGNLIWQGYANGGELVWDGKDFKGRRPATGVYFVFSSSKSGKEKNVAKFLFVN